MIYLMKLFVHFAQEPAVIALTNRMSPKLCNYPDKSNIDLSVLVNARFRIL